MKSSLRQFNFFSLFWERATHTNNDLVLVKRPLPPGAPPRSPQCVGTAVPIVPVVPGPLRMVIRVGSPDNSAVITPTRGAVGHAVTLPAVAD